MYPVFEAFKDFWNSPAADSGHCHIGRSQTGIVEIRAGIHYGQGELLATGTETQPGEAVPILLVKHS